MIETPDWGPVHSLIERVPDFHRFHGVEELVREVEAIAREYPSLARLGLVGTSRLGEPIVGLTVGSGARTALVFGMPHPNEPFGALTASFLARALCEDAALRDGWSWHIIPCIDPDGTRLNEPWFDGPFTREHYSRNFYRPAFGDQIEWTFPSTREHANVARPQPETLALMRLIDELEPDLLCALHNSEAGGVYYYLSAPAPPLYEILTSIAEQAGLPLDLGEPESPDAKLYAPAIFGWSLTDERYDAYIEAGRDPAEWRQGSASTDYAQRHGTFSIITEVPNWPHASADDTSPTSERLADLMGAQITELRQLETDILATLAEAGSDLVPETPFLRAVHSFVEWIPGHAETAAKRASSPASDRIATIAEQYSLKQVMRMFRLRYGGMLLRALDAPISAGIATYALRRARSTFAARFDLWLAEDEAAGPGEPRPIGKLVSVQAGAILAAAIYLADRSETE